MANEQDYTEKLILQSDISEEKWKMQQGVEINLCVSSNVEAQASRRLELAAFLIALSSFLWGYSVSVLNVCIVNNAKGSMLVDINLSTEEEETATALVLVGAAFAALTTGGLGEYMGYKTIILFNNFFYVAGTLLCALATEKIGIFMGRFTIGIACGIVTNNVPILLTEISPSYCRGKITSLHQLNLTLGILVSGIIGYIVIEQVPSGWRYLNAFMLIPAITQLLALQWIPESPWWLMKHRGREASKRTLEYLRISSYKDIDNEVQMISSEMQSRANDKQTSWSDLWSYRTPLTIGVILVFYQAMTGINTVMLYSAKIFQCAGVTNPFFATVAVGVVNVLVTIISVYLVDSYGRKPLLLIGTGFMFKSLIILSWALLFLDNHLKAQGIVAVICVLVFVGGFAVSLGAVVWVVLADITPVQIRSRSFAVFMSINYLCNILVAVYTLSAINFLGRGPHKEKNGIAKLYGICAFVSLTCFLFVYFYLDETKNHMEGSATGRNTAGSPGIVKSHQVLSTYEEKGALLSDYKEEGGQITQI